MALNFNDVLNTKVSEIERPPLIPVGHYQAKVYKIPTTDTIGKDEWDTLDFPLQLIAAGEDVDQEALAAYGGLGNHSRLNRRFMFNKNDQANFDRSMFNVRRFLADHLKVDDAENKALKQAINDSMNCICTVFIKHRQDKDDKELFYAEIAQTSPAE